MAKPHRIRMPALLREKRAPGRDNITKRDWSKNPLGEVFTKDNKPERTDRLKFYASAGEAGSPETHRQHRIFERKIRRFINARPFRDMGIEIVKGRKHGFYYVKAKSIQTDEAIFIRIDLPEYREAARFLEEGPSAGKTPALLVERRRVREPGNITKRDWSQNRLGKFFSKPPKYAKSLRFYATQAQVGDAKLHNQYDIFESKIRSLINARSNTDLVTDIVKSRGGRYYVKIKSYYTDKRTPESAIFIRIDEPTFINSVKFLEHQAERWFLKQKGKR